MRKYVPALISVFILLCCVPAFAQGSSRVFKLEVEGNAAINQSDIAGAREGAIQDALQKAVMEAAAVVLSLSVKDERILPVKSKIIEQADRYISNYKIINENKQADTYSVTVNVAVALLDLKSDLAGIISLPESRQEKKNIIVFLDVKGLKQYSDFLSLKEFLKRRSKVVKNIQPRSFEWQQAHLEVEISGTVQALAEELAKAGRYVLGTRQINNNQIEITLLQKGDEQ
jgi:hypothetical protein